MMQTAESTLAKRVIPCLDVKNGRTVKGTNFIDLRDAGDPVELAARYSDEGADELVFLDISATLEDRSPFYDLIKRLSQAIRIPFTVGGGIRTTADLQRALDAGADKVSLNSAILEDPEVIDRCAELVGSQSVVAAIDVRKEGQSWTVWTRAGTSPTGRDARAWAREVAARGAGEILLTSMDRDGTTTGYDIPLLRSLASEITIPLIASGGAGTIDHLLDALVEGRADAVLAASIFHFQTVRIGEVKAALDEHGIPVRTTK
jgi:cyclase